MSEPAESTARNTQQGGLAGLLRRLVVLQPGEGPVLLAAFAMLFCIFTSYSVLRPVRDTMGITSGVQNLPTVFWGTFLVMLLVQPVYGWLTSRFKRRVFLPWVYGFFIACLMTFYLWFNFQEDHTWIARCYFVWVSVFNLFVIATFWSLMSDVLTREQAGRMFGFIAAGMSLGGLAGPWMTTTLTRPLAAFNPLAVFGHNGGAADEMGTINLLLVSAIMLLLSMVFLGMINAWDDRHGSVHGGTAGGEEAVGGSIWAAFTQVVRSPYLLGIALFVFLLTWITTPLYLQQSTFVSNLTQAPSHHSSPAAAGTVTLAAPPAAAGHEHAAGGHEHSSCAPTSAEVSPTRPLCLFHSKDEQTQFFGRIDFWVQTASLIGQLLIFGHLFKWLGLRVTLCAVPVLLVIGYVVFAFMPIFPVVVGLYAMRRVGDYALTRPARESLFTVVSRDEKYKAKSLIDTFVYRGGDATNGTVYDLLTKSLGVSASGIGWFGAILSAIWLVLAYGLGKAQERTRSGQASAPAPVAHSG